MTKLNFIKEGNAYVAEYSGVSGGIEIRCASNTNVTIAGDVSGNRNYKTIGTDLGSIVIGYLDMDGLTRVKITCECSTQPTGYVKYAN